MTAYELILLKAIMFAPLHLTADKMEICVMDLRMPHAFARTTCARYHVSEPFKRKIKALVLKLAVELWVLFSQESAQPVK